MVYSIGSLSYDYFILNLTVTNTNLALNLTNIILSSLCLLFSDYIFKIGFIKKWVNDGSNNELNSHLLDNNKNEI